MSRKIKLPTGAEAEVVEHAPGEWFGRVPAALVDWNDTGAVECKLAETEAAWAEHIVRTGEQNRLNATRVTADDVRAALAELRARTPHRRATLGDIAGLLHCHPKTIRNALAAVGQNWKEI